MSKKTMQLVFAGIIILAWIGAGVVAIFDGITMLKITTPALMIVLGWLFTAKATTA